MRPLSAFSFIALLIFLCGVRAGTCPAGFNCTSTSTTVLWSLTSSPAISADQLSFEQPPGVLFEVDFSSSEMKLNRSSLQVDQLDVFDSILSFLNATQGSIVSSIMTRSLVEFEGRSVFSFHELTLVSSTLVLEFGSSLAVSSLTVNNSNVSVTAPPLARRLLLENVTYTLIDFDNATWSEQTPLAAVYAPDSSSAPSCELISVASFGFDAKGFGVKFAINRSQCDYRVPGSLTAADFASIVRDPCFDAGPSCAACAISTNCTYCPLLGVCAGRGVNVSSACDGVTLTVCASAPTSAMAVELIVGVVSAALIAFWSGVVISIYLFQRFRRKRKSSSFDTSNSLPTENNSNDIMSDIMIVNNDASSSTECAGTHSIEQLALAFVTTPNLPPLYDTSSEGTVDGADSFGESSPDPAHYRRVDPATLVGLDPWKIESGSGPLLIDENMNLLADVEVRDLLVIAARVAILGTEAHCWTELLPDLRFISDVGQCTVFSRGKIEIVPGAFLEVTGVYEDFNEPDPVLRFRVPSATPQPPPTSSRTVVLTRQPSLSNTATEVKESAQFHSISSLQSADSLSLANDATASAPDTTSLVSSFRRPSAVVIVPSRSRDDRRLYGDSSSAREISVTAKLSMTSLSLPGLSEQRSEDHSRPSRDSQQQRSQSSHTRDDAMFIRILEQPASVAPPEILRLKGDQARNDVAGSEEDDEDGPRDKLSRPSPPLLSKSSAHSLSSIGVSVSRKSSTKALKSSIGKKTSRLDSTPPSEEISEEKPPMPLRRYRGPHEKDALDDLIHNVLDPHSISQSTSISTVTHDKRKPAQDSVLDAVRSATNSQRQTPNNTVRVIPASVLVPLPPAPKEPPPVTKPRRPQTVLKDEITSSEEDAKSSLDEKEEFESETDTLEEIFASVLGTDKNASNIYSSPRIQDVQDRPAANDASTPLTSSSESDSDSDSGSSPHSSS